MESPIKIFILGSCVSRDPFEFSEAGDFEIVDYVARTSIASLGAQPFVDEKILENIESNWQRQMVFCDMNKSTYSKLAEKEFDILLIDLIDERFGLAIDGSSIHTVSTEYKKALYSPNNYKFIKSIDEHKFRCWEKGLEKLVIFIKENGYEDKVVINKLYWTVQGEPLQNTLEERYGYQYIDNVNANLDRMYARFKEKIPGSRFLEYSNLDIKVDVNHKWGLEPFHYCKDMQLKQLSVLKKLYSDMQHQHDGLSYFEDDKGRRMYYRYTPALSECYSPLLVILHGHTYNVKPSKYANENLNVLAPIDNFGVNNCGSWWLGENGDFFVKDILHSLIKEKLMASNSMLLFWGSSMGGFGAILHSILLKANAAYANIPQIKLIGSTYSNMGMKKFFIPIFEDDTESIYNDLSNLLENKAKEIKAKEFPLFFIAQSRYDYECYLEEQSLCFFKKCLELEINLHYEVFPKKGHSLMMPVNDSIEKMLSYVDIDNYKVKVDKKNINSVVFGLMNFSVLYSSTRAYKAASKSYEEYKSSILNRDRLKVREDIFFHHTVPLLIDRHDAFLDEGTVLRFNVAISDQLPMDVAEKFNSLILEHGDIFNIIKVSETKPHNWLKILEEDFEYLNEAYSLSGQEVVFANFRLDDDDVLSVDYFKHLSEYLDSTYEGFYLTFPSGYVGIYDKGYKEAYKINKPYLAIGLSKICKYNLSDRRITTENPIVSSTPHTLIVNNSKTILDSRFAAYIWTMHNFSDTRSNDVNARQSSSKIKQFIEDNKLEKADSLDFEKLLYRN